MAGKKRIGDISPKTPLGTYLQAGIDKMKITVYELAKRSGVTQGQIARIIKGTGGKSLHEPTLQALAAALAPWVTIEGLRERMWGEAIQSSVPAPGIRLVRSRSVEIRLADLEEQMDLLAPLVQQARDIREREIAGKPTKKHRRV